MVKREKAPVDDTPAKLSVEERADVRFKELSGEVKIDRNDLDTMLVEQANLLREAGDQHALAVSRRDYADARMKEVKAELDFQLRRGKDKLSETQIVNRILTMEPFQESQENYLRFKRKADRWFALKESFHDRSYMLKELSQKQSNEYRIDN